MENTTTPKYIRLKKDAPNGSSYLKKGVIFTLSKSWRRSEEHAQYNYTVTTASGGASFATNNLEHGEEYWEEVAQEEIDKLIANAEFGQHVLRSYIGEPWFGVWIEQPYRHFIYNEK